MGGKFTGGKTGGEGAREEAMDEQSTTNDTSIVTWIRICLSSGLLLFTLLVASANNLNILPSGELS
jgi:hypothetical protein